MIRENKYPVPDLILPRNVLVSVFDKIGLEVMVKAILAVNPETCFFSTGGTGGRIIAILEQITERPELNYMSVEDFTGAPEMEGGLVKTLHPKIHAGLLAERNNPAHEEYLSKTLGEMGLGVGVYFDIFIGNLYPFAKVIAEDGSTAETARVNIDIGGPTMTMAAAKNWHSVAVISSPDQYAITADSLMANKGTALRQRFDLACQAFALVGQYRMAIGRYFFGIGFEQDVKPFLKLQEVNHGPNN